MRRAPCGAHSEYIAAFFLESGGLMPPFFVSGGSPPQSAKELRGIFGLWIFQAGSACLILEPPGHIPERLLLQGREPEVAGMARPAHRRGARKAAPPGIAGRG